MDKDFIVRDSQEKKLRAQCEIGTGMYCILTVESFLY